MNVPYVKQYKEGQLQNPIKDTYPSGQSLRKFKRNHLRTIKSKILIDFDGKPKTIVQQRSKRGVWFNLN